MEDKPYSTNNATEFNSYTDIVQAVTKDASGIGYSSPQLAAKMGARNLTIDGTAPVATSGNYPYKRVLHLFTDKTRETPATHGFIEFAKSTAGQRIVDEMGYTPNP